MERDVPRDAAEAGPDADVGDDAPDGCVPRPEICDGIDNDCDGPVDEDLGPAPCPVQEGVCAGAMGECVGGVRRCGDAQYREAAEVHGAPFDGIAVGEVACDGADNNCDGRVDERCCGDVNDAWVRADGPGRARASEITPSVALVGAALFVAWQDTDSVGRPDPFTDDGQIRVSEGPVEGPFVARVVDSIDGGEGRPFVRPAVVDSGGVAHLAFGAAGPNPVSVRIKQVGGDEHLGAELPSGTVFTGLDGASSSLGVVVVWDQHPVGDDGLYAIDIGRFRFDPETVRGRVAMADDIVELPAVGVNADMALVAWWNRGTALAFRAVDLETLSPVGGNNVHQLMDTPLERPDVFAVAEGFGILYSTADPNELLLLRTASDGDPIGVPTRIRSGGDNAILAARGVGLSGGSGIVWVEDGVLWYRLAGPAPRDVIVLRTTATQGAGLSVAAVSSQEFVVAAVDVQTAAVWVGRFNSLGLPLCQ